MTDTRNRSLAFALGLAALAVIIAPAGATQDPAILADDGELLGEEAIDQIIGASDLLAQLAQPAPVVTRRVYRPQYSIPAATGGYQAFQNTYRAAVTYWNGAQPAAPTYSYATPTYNYAAPAARPAAPAAPAATGYAAGDPYGFTAWLNGVRARYGLSAVSYDPNLSAWASQNNAAQQSRGLGHHVMGPARRQNSAMGNSGSVGGQWMASPAHRAALLDPTIRAIGIAGMGMYWTFNAR